MELNEKPVGIGQKLLEIQRDLKCEKSQFNTFGGFQYRSKEDILEALKPLAHERGCTVVVEDEVLCLPNNWVYITATATLADVETGESASAKGVSREAESKKGADASQITGMASSYAGKRALGNLFALDDTKDADAPVQEQKPIPKGPFNARCRICGTVYQFNDEAQMIYCAQAGACCPSPSYEVI